MGPVVVEVAAPARPWRVTGVVLFGTYVVIINLTVIGIALPAISRDLGSGSWLSADWVVTSYFVAIVIAQPLVGWLVDTVGRKQVYVASIVVFAAGSLVCATAPTMTVLVIGRAVQGLAGGAVTPLGTTIVYELFPPERRGSGMGLWGVATMSAPAFGPPLGGWLLSAGSWRLIFVVLFVISVAGAALGLRLLPALDDPQARRLDWQAWLLAGIGFTALVVTSREGPSWGLRAPTVVLGACAVGALVWFVARSLRSTDPLIDFRMFANPVFRWCMVLMLIAAVAQFARLTFLPIEFELIHDMSTQQVGLILAPPALGIAAMMPVGGRLADRIGPRVPAIGGLALMACGTLGLAGLHPGTAKEWILALLVLQGLGMGLSAVPMTVAALDALPARQVPEGSATISLNRQVSGAVGTAVLSMVIIASLGALVPEKLGSTLADREHMQAAYNTVFLITASGLAAATALAVMLPRRVRQLIDSTA